MYTHRININRRYKKSSVEENYYFTTEPDHVDKFNSMESFNKKHRREKNDVTKIEVKPCKLKPIIK